MSEPTARSAADRPMADQTDQDQSAWIPAFGRTADRQAVPLAEAAQIAGTTTDALRHRYRRGTLPGYRIGRRLFLFRDSLPGVDRPSERSAGRTPSDRDRPEIDLLRAQLAVNPLAEAAQIAGTSTDALRHRYRRGTLPGYRIGRRLFLYRDSLPGVDRPRERPDGRTATDRDRPEIELLRAQLAVKDQQLAVKDDQIRQLHVLLGRIQEHVALPAPEASSPPRSWWRRLWR